MGSQRRYPWYREGWQTRQAAMARVGPNSRQNRRWTAEQRRERAAAVAARLLGMGSPSIEPDNDGYEFFWPGPYGALTILDIPGE